jgi:hypothetical protein
LVARICEKQHGHRENKHAGKSGNKPGDKPGKTNLPTTLATTLAATTLAGGVWSGFLEEAVFGEAGA